eukprot:5399669-Heterocapsa_arctica.AAC.1
MVLKFELGLSSSDSVQNDQRPARNLMVIARMPEDPSKPSKTSENLQGHIHLYAYTCRAH